MYRYHLRKTTNVVKQLIEDAPMAKPDPTYAGFYMLAVYTIDIAAGAGGDYEVAHRAYP
jgi:hypothetical protein